jgi:hypothetical protein
MRMLAVALIAAGAMFSAVPTASAAETGVLAVVPAQGTLDTPIDVVTSGVCTRGVTFVVAVRGPGLDAQTSGNAVGNTGLEVLEPPLYPGRYAVPLARSLREFFVANGVGAPKGEYDLIFACRNRLDFEDLQTFSGTIRIKGDNYTAVAEAATPLEEFVETPVTEAPASQAQDPEAEVETSGSQEGAVSDPGSGVSVDAATGTDDASGNDVVASPAADQTPLDGEPVAESVAVEAADTSTSSDSWRTLLIVAGVLLLLGAGYAWWRGRDKPTPNKAESDDSVGVGS